ncbi:4-hydroxybenzoate polyprenyltransferase [Pedobacter cryoconitis]|uniref:4-hydroxybenzoate polyprenyltransferase n=1 Tax=Pedobacter cryoconitis TaxID=188932 RepID=A0A7W9DZI3_9SPHI|nr:UbiA family prenyltransferase [Pedobacter cryoconitis]MBB5637372.1 4-hydroxybenzoate polyprenyltransferase [Pedobacter cryoconitis]
MKFLEFTRSSEWWEYKMVPLLSVGYATLLLQHYPITQAILKLLFLLSAVIIGAVYVSVINDISDIKEDAIAGKKNRMARISPPWRIAIVSLCLITGVINGYFIYPDRLSLFFYIMAWVVFSLYSLPPVRLKKRGIWGLLCDAMGAHLFPSLFITSSLLEFSHADKNVFWYIAVGIWALFYGLRGILWHQFYDRENDLKSGTTTFASAIRPENFKTREAVVFSVELIAFSGVLFFIFNLWIAVSIGLYLILIRIRKTYLNHKICLIITPAHAPHQLLMNDYYLVFFPLSLLFTLSLNHPSGWLVLFFHLLLFPRKTLFALKDIIACLKRN